MAKFKQCPANAQRKVRSGTFCEDYVLEHCEGCNMFTAYQIGRADAWKEALELQRSQTVPATQNEPVAPVEASDDLPFE